MDYKRISSISDDPSLDIYFREIGGLAVLTEAEESNLAIKAKAGNRKALDKLVESNLRFVVSVAKDFQGRGMSMADLINEGNFGLMRAIKRYDPSRGYRFNTYAVWWIRQAILKAIAEQTRMVRLPMNRIDQLNKINKAVLKLQAQKPNFGGRPSARQISKVAKISEDDVTELLGYSSNEVSLDAPTLDGEGKSLGDTMENQAYVSPEQVLKNKTMDHDIKRVLSLLTPREEKIVKMYYGLENNDEGTLDSIGRKFNISRERVRQLKDRALKKIKCANESDRLRTYLD